MTTNAPENVADRLREALAAAGLSQRKLAARLAGKEPKRTESYRRQIVRWTSGDSIPDPESARRLADALDKPSDYFITPPEIRPAGVKHAVGRIDERLDRLEAELERLRELGEEIRDLLPAGRDEPRRRRGGKR